MHTLEDQQLPALIQAAAAFCDGAIDAARALTPAETAEALACLSTGEAHMCLQIDFLGSRTSPAVRLRLGAVEDDGEPVATIFESTAIPLPDRMRN